MMPKGSVESPRATKAGRRFPITQGLLALTATLGIVAWGIHDRVEAHSELVRQTEAEAIPTVAAIQPNHGPDDEEAVLPGTIQARTEAPIYARTNGYVKAWYTDIGTMVKKGQLLAELDTPEVDAQLRQAEADLATADANDALARSTAKRWSALLATDSVSKQETDEKLADAAAKDALVAAARANVARLRDLEEFKRVVAPFDGVVTARNTDVGALINAGSGPGSQLFRVADTSRLRIYVRVPQAYAPATKVGLVADLHFTEHADRVFPAKVVRTADAIEPDSRTLLVELEEDNATHEILPGSYTEVHFHFPLPANTLRLPVSALVFRSAGLQVAKVDAGGRVTMTPITLGRDFGTQVEVVSGISLGDTVLLSPPDALADGAQIRLASNAAKTTVGALQ